MNEKKLDQENKLKEVAKFAILYSIIVSLQSCGHPSQHGFKQPNRLLPPGQKQEMVEKRN
jgi:hypothetical protein